MNTHTTKPNEKTHKPIASEISQAKPIDPSISQLVDNRPESAVQQHMHATSRESSALNQTTQLKPMIDKRSTSLPVQKTRNNTGLPDHLKSGIEALSGMDMSDVNVHYNSEKPAQLNAHAYAQGTDIHIASGQEKHLPHEAWHVVQQKQGRVKPTLQMKEQVNVNDDSGLEKEADVMGEKALIAGSSTRAFSSKPFNNSAISTPVIQGNFIYTASVILDREGAEHKRSNQIQVDSIDLPETERPPTQYGDKQQAHSVSWTLLKQAYSRMSAGSLTALLAMLKADWAALSKQSDIMKNNDAHKEFNQYLQKYTGDYFDKLNEKSASFLNWYGITQKLVTDYFVALQLSALATHTGYTLKINAFDPTIHEHQPLGHGEPQANAYFQQLEQHLQGNVADQSEEFKKSVLQHAKYYWDPGIGYQGGINETDHVKLIIHKYETAFSRAFPKVWENYQNTIQVGLSKDAMDQVAKFTGKGHSQTKIEKIEDEDQEDVGLEEHNTGGFQASVKLSEHNVAGAAPATDFKIASYEIIGIALPNDRPVTKYGVIGQKSHTVSWTLVIQSLHALGANKQLSVFLQGLLTRWEDLKRQDWEGMITSNLISGTDLERRKIQNTIVNIMRYNQENAARLTKLKDKIPDHIAILHRMVKGESFTDVEWAHQVQKSIADYVIVYQSSPLATYKTEPNPKGHGEPDANDWLSHINNHIIDKNMKEIADKYFKDTFKGQNIVKSNFQGNDQSDKDRAVELGAIHKTGTLDAGQLEEIEQKLVKHLTLKYLDVKWTTVGSDLESSPHQYAQILVEWEEAIEKAFPKVWEKHGAYLKTYAENIVLSKGLQDNQAVKLNVVNHDRANLQEEQTKLKPWVRKEREYRAGKRGLLSIQSGDETMPVNEDAAYLQAKQHYDAGRIAAHTDPTKPVAADAHDFHKQGHQDYLEGLEYAKNHLGGALPLGRNLAFNIGFKEFQNGFYDAKNKKTAIDGSVAYKQGHQAYFHNLGFVAGKNGLAKPNTINQAFNNGYDQGLLKRKEKRKKDIELARRIRGERF